MRDEPNKAPKIGVRALGLGPEFISITCPSPRRPTLSVWTCSRIYSTPVYCTWAGNYNEHVPRSYLQRYGTGTSSTVDFLSDGGPMPPPFYILRPLMWPSCIISNSELSKSPASYPTLADTPTQESQSAFPNSCGEPTFPCPPLPNSRIVSQSPKRRGIGMDDIVTFHKYT